MRLLLDSEAESISGGSGGMQIKVSTDMRIKTVSQPETKVQVAPQTINQLNVGLNTLNNIGINSRLTGTQTVRQVNDLYR